VVETEPVFVTANVVVVAALADGVKTGVVGVTVTPRAVFVVTVYWP